MPKQLNVNLGFTADTSKARKQIQDLQQSITNLMKATDSDNAPLKLGSELKEASLAASQLKQMLTSATNVDTGKLDLGKFSMQLRQSNITLDTLGKSLSKMGPQGEKTFLKLTKAIAQSDITLNRTKGLVDDLWVTLKNTARWQLSSSMLHGFMGTIQSAYGYAQDLNRSLNDIRIVTGQSVDQMDRFAEKANKAARALSASTTEYTNAALIFYQQGLGDQEVEERTNATIKMAHAAGENATQVSSYMTAIWNNFDDGSKSLEYYGDVITKLGASTAASSAEIAEGLEKFAAIGENVGLSYEYATSAIATVVDKTRQSADVVGTAFKTIFSRLQGLNLGETLDDGTDLNKYSQALLSVGINIKDANGELKDMDNILDEMGAKWKTLHRDEQMALAQTVAGVRQYTQLMSLMNNYDDFKGNVLLAETSGGTLNSQAEIYAESWEAAQARVKAASEDFWDTLINDDFFIDLLGIFEKLIIGVNSFTDSIGGVPGLLSGIGIVASTVFGQQMAGTFDNLKLDLMTLMGLETQVQQEAQDLTKQMLQNRADIDNDAYNTATRGAEYFVEDKQAQLRDQLIAKSKKLSQQELTIVQYMMDQNDALGQQIISYAKISDQARHAGAEMFDEFIFDGLGDDFSEAQKAMEALALQGTTSMNDYKAVLSSAQNGEEAFIDVLNRSSLSQEKKDAIIKKLCQTYREMGVAQNNADTSTRNFNQSVEQTSATIQNGVPSITSFGQSVVACMNGVSRCTMAFNSFKSAWNALTNPDLSAFEKFTQITTSMAMGIPMMVSGLKAMKTAISETAVAQAAANIFQFQSLKLDTEEAKTEALKFAAKKLGITVERDATKEILKKIIADKLGIANGEKLATVTLLNATLEKINTFAKKGSITATIAQTVANWALNASMSPLLVLTIAITAALAALAAIIFIVVSAVQSITAAYNKDAVEAENLANAAKNLADAYNEVKEEYNSMIDAMNNYNSAREGLESLTKGTQEYREALTEANNAAMKLIELGNLIKGQDYDVINGEIIINDSAIEAAKNAKFNQMQEAYSSSTMASANASRAQAQSRQTDLVRKNDGAAVGIGAFGGAFGGALAGAAIGSAVPVIGTVIGAAVGAIGGAIINGIQNSEEQSKIDELTALYNEIGVAAFDSATLQKLGFDTTNEAYIKSLKDVVVATAEAADQMEVAAQIAAQSILEQDSSFQNSKYKDKISDTAGKNYQTEYDKAYNTYLEKTKNNDWFGVGSQENKDAMAEYAKQMKLDQLNGYRVTNYKKGGNVEYEYIDENGEKQTREITQQQIAAQLAAADATKQLEANTQTLLQAFNRLEGSADAADKALSDFAGGDIKNATKTEFDDLQSELKNYKTIDANGNEVTDFTKYITENFSEEEITALGYESAEKMAEAFEKEFNSSLEAWESITIPPAFKALGTDMSLKTAQALENTFKEINLGPGGEQVAKTFSNTFTKALGELNAEDQQKALEQLMTIDWSSWDSLEQAADIMTDFGVEIDTTSEEWQQFTSDMRLATGAIPDFSRLKEDLNTISGILSDLEFGAVVSEEDYQTLVKYNDEWERFFMLQTDGSRTFIGNASQMRQEMQENIRQQRRELEARKAAQTGFADAGWGHTDANGTRIEADWANKSGKDIGTAQNLMNAGGATEEALKMLGYTDEIIQNIITKATSGQADLVAESEAELREMYYRLGEFQDEQLAGMDAQFDEMMASTADNLYELNELLATGDISEEAWAKQAQVLETNAAQNAETLAQLDSVVSNFGLNELDESYTQNLMRIAEGYESCADELANYQATLSAFTLDSSNDELKEQLKLAEDNLRAMIKLEEGAAEYGLEVEVLTAQSKRLAKAYDLTAEEAAELAVKNQRMNKGISSLVDNWKDWKKQLSASNKLTQDYAEAVVDCTAAIADLVGASKDLELPDEFFNAENIALIERAMQGDVDAVNKLGAAVAETTVKSWEFNEAFASLINQLETWDGEVITIDLDEQHFLDDRDIVLQGINDIKNGVITADQAMSDEWVAALNRMALATGMSVEQMNSMLGSLGVQAKVDVKDVPQVMKVPTYTEVTEPIPVTAYESYFTGTSLAQVPTTRYMWRKYSIPGPSMEVNGVAQVAQISTTDNPLTAQVTRSTVGGGAPAASYSPNRGPVAPSATKGSNSGGGGGSKEKEPSKPKKTDKTKENEIVERYKEINDALDDLSDEYEKASRSADHLWGEHRLDALREQNKLIAEQQDLLAKKQKEAENYMKQDRAALQSAAAAVGLAFSFDENGNITNYTDQMTALYQQLSNAEDHYNSLTTGEDQESYEETILEPLRDKIAAIEDAMELYEESRELFEELGLEIDDLQDQIMQNNYDIIMEGLELHISFNEEDLEVIDYYLSKIEDDFYKMHEAAALMVGPQLDEYKDNLKEYTEAMNELHRAYAAGEITEAMYQEGLEEVRAGIRDNLSSLVELDKTMMEYYGETVAMAQEELAKYTAQMENHVAVLEHYQNLMSILGKETDFNALGIILEGQAKTAENAMKVSKENYEMYKRQVEAIEEKIAKATTDEEKAFLEKEWEAATTAMMEAQQDMLDKTEAWAESLRAILENKLSGFAQDLENALTGGTSFDTLTTSMERAASLQEEYLTTTNQIYETNKLMRTAQQAIDASTSSIAKNKLKQFINETKQLQDQNKLSEYELEIQQAKYNLLLAEMALEDARDAKTVVRLKRDNEGNLGYVYTADQDKLAEAQQELEDAQNSLYNIGLEGANEYSEKYQQTMSEMYDTFTELQEQYLSGEFETEAEYQDAMLKAKEYYYEKLKNYSSLHQVALTTDARVVADAWSSEYSDMIFNTEDWMRHVTDYVHNVNDAFTEWNNNVDMIANETLGPDLDSLESNVKDITDANDELTKSITGDGGVIDAIEGELDQVSNLTGKYATLRQQIQGLIADHEQMMVRMGNEPNPYTPPGTGTAGSGSSGGSSSSGSGGSSSSGSSSSGSSGSSNGAYGSSGSGSNDVNAPDYSDLTKQGVALAIWNGGFGWGNGTTRRNRLDEKGFDPEEIQRIIDITNPNGDWRTRYGISDLSKYAYSSFGTGGYTGAWGSYGKFAMLHEKELVLNSGETENFLASMEVLRSIIKMIDLQSTASQLGGLLHSPGYYAPQTSDVLEQNVHIEASFPEATDRYEIEAALTSIVNRASQYANRK